MLHVGQLKAAPVCVCVFVCVCVQVIAYMMKEYQMALTEAKKLVKSIRGCINPNDGFMGQLRSYEGILTARLAHGALHTHTHTHTHTQSSHHTNAICRYPYIYNVYMYMYIHTCTYNYNV